MTAVTMTAGKYWVGDLCYVLGDRWDEVCSKTIRGREVLEGKFALDDGLEFVMLKTAHGDGVYVDQDGLGYGVDSGSIGAVSAEDADIVPESFGGSLGHVAEFDGVWEATSEEGVLSFGHVVIDTDCDDDDDDIALFLYGDEDDEDE